MFFFVFFCWWLCFCSRMNSDKTKNDSIMHLCGTIHFDVMSDDDCVCIFILIVIQFSFSFSFSFGLLVVFSLFFLLLQHFHFIYSKKTYWLNFHQNKYIIKDFYWELWMCSSGNCSRYSCWMNYNSNKIMNRSEEIQSEPAEYL